MSNQISDKEMTTETAVDRAGNVVEEVQHKAGETIAVAKDQVKRTASRVGDQAKTTVDTRLSDVAQELGSVADAVRQTSYEVGSDSEVVTRYGERIAEQLEGISSYLNDNGVEEVLNDLQAFARRQPAVFLGGAFMLGIVVGRFLRSSGERGIGYGRGAQERYMDDYSGGVSRRDTTISGGHSGSSYSDTSPYGYEGRNRYQTGIDQASTTSQE